jgi:16S rRNA (uracil1498-N3)-methyltransferase
VTGLLPSGSGGPHVFVDDLDVPAVSEDDAHHLDRVLRLRAGDPLTAADGAGRWRSVRYGAPLEVAGEVVDVGRPDPPLTVACALVKGERPELVVQKLTELGIDRIAVFAARRSVVRWDDDRAARHLERLRRVAREASMQSRRCWLPEVTGVLTFDEVVALDGVALADRDGPPLNPSVHALAIGPEGGWDDDEAVADVPRVGLGRHVLRAETAAIAAGVVLAAARDGFIGHAG